MDMKKAPSRQKIPKCLNKGVRSGLVQCLSIAGVRAVVECGKQARREYSEAVW